MATKTSRWDIEEDVLERLRDARGVEYLQKWRTSYDTTTDMLSVSEYVPFTGWVTYRIEVAKYDANQPLPIGQPYTEE